ncbi:MAG: type II toxin-antitoxin system Phd/YefM family antitoxin [Pseudomonadota bacterium]
MSTFSALEAKNRLGQIIDAAQREPVTITRHGRPAVVVLAVQEYEALLAGTSTLIRLQKPPEL